MLSKATLAELEQDLTRDAGLGVGAPRTCCGELLLEDAVGVLRLLLLSELDGVLGLLLAAAVVAVLAWAVRTALECLVWAENGLLEATGNLGLGSAVTCHVVLLTFFTVQQRSDATVLWRAAAVVWQWGDVHDFRHFDAHVVQGADGALATAVRDLSRTHLTFFKPYSMASFPQSSAAHIVQRKACSSWNRGIPSCQSWTRKSPDRCGIGE